MMDCLLVQESLLSLPMCDTKVNLTALGCSSAKSFGLAPIETSSTSTYLRTETINLSNPYEEHEIYEFKLIWPKAMIYYIAR